MMKKTLTLFSILFTGLIYAQFDAGHILDSLGLQDVFAGEMADMDGDSDLDMVIVQTSQIVLYENMGFGEFADPVVVSGIDVASTESTQLFLEDMNGDDLVDIVFSMRNYSFSANSLCWFSNNGDGTYNYNGLETALINYIDVKDYNGDGSMDVVFIKDDELVYRENDAAGVFASEVLIYEAGFNFVKFFSTDYNFDGDIDFLTIEETLAGTMGLHFIENMGAGVYGSPAIIFSAVDDFSVFDIQFVDNDEDGDEDWFLTKGTFEPYQVVYYENTIGTLAAEVLISNIFGDVKIADYNNDGLQDVMYGIASNAFEIVANLDGGVFAEPIEYNFFFSGESGVLHGSKTLMAEDLDGDGDLEIYVDMSGDQFFMMKFENLTIDDYARGTVFIDLNGNGTQELGEEGASFLPIGTTPDEGADFTSSEGIYGLHFNGVGEAYEIYPILPSFWEITSSESSYMLTTDGVTNWDNLDFGIFPTASVDSIRTELVGEFPRCNSEVNYWIGVFNTGSTTPNGVIALTIDDSLDYVSADVVPDSIVGQTYYWSYSSLALFGVEGINVVVEMPDFMSIGDDVESIVLTTIEGTDFVSETNLVQTVSCAYDPNDKTASPAGEGSNGFVAIDLEYLDYTIRFQNTGNDTAINVRIEDQLFEELDWSSVTTLAYSHPMSMAINETGKLIFNFDNIMLPDSVVNEAESHGFVKFRVNLVENLPVGTTIYNRAEIYFDSNPAINTNLTINSLFDCQEIVDRVEIVTETCFGDSIPALVGPFFVPSSTTFSWETGGVTYDGREVMLSLADIGTNEVVFTTTTSFCSASATFESSMIALEDTLLIDEINICALDSALVFGTYRMISGPYYESSISAAGCEVVNRINLTVNALPEIGVLPDVIVCEGDSVLVFGNYVTEAGTYEQASTTIDGCDSTSTKTVIITSNPTVTITPLVENVICLFDVAIELTGTPSGGYFIGGGVDGTTFNPSVAGEGVFGVVYTYTDDNGCIGVDETSITVESCLGVAENGEKMIKIYPNPFNSVAQVVFSEALKEGHDLIIYDAQGKEVKRMRNLTGTSIEISKDELGVGIFLLQLINSKNETEIFSTKLIVE